MGNTRSALEPYATEDIIHIPRERMVTKRRKKLAPSVFNIYRPNLGDKGIESFKASSSSCSVSSSESSSSYTVSLPISDENEHKNLKEATTIADQDYIILEGRKYLNTPGNHFYSPCDDEEADRMVMMHFLIKYAFGGNWNAPIQSILQFKSSRENPSKVLDVGCGTGTWVLEMASEFPHAEIYGIDVRAMFPHTSNPSNTHFIQYDYLKRLPYPDNTFDYIRMRLMLAFTTEKQFVRLLSEMHRVLKPLGYIEILDCEYRIHHNGVETAKLEEGIYDRLEKLYGITAFHGQLVSTYLMSQPRQGGFLDIHRQKIAIPLGWGSHYARFHLREFSRHLRSLHPTLKKGMNIEDERNIEKIGQECIRNHAYMEWFVCYAQKAPDLPALWMSSLSCSEENALLTAANVEDRNTWQDINDLTEGYTE